MRGIILAGGTGSRLFPATISVSKQLLPVAGRPLVQFPLCTLMEAGIREVCVITMPDEQDRFRRLLGDGAQWGLNICYAKQPEANGLPEAFIIAASFIKREPVTLILGDNVFIGLPRFDNPFKLATIYAVQVANPKRYGVVAFDERGDVLSVREKPKFSSSKWAVAGLYSFAPSVVEIAQGLKPSARGELEIVDVIEEYNRRGQLRAHKLPPSAIWFDCGTPDDLMEATNLIAAFEKRSGEILGSPELTALRQGFITQEQFNELVRQMPANCEYRNALERASSLTAKRKSPRL